MMHKDEFLYCLEDDSIELMGNEDNKYTKQGGRKFLNVELWQCEDEKRDKSKLDSTCVNTEDEECETVDPPCD